MLRERRHWESAKWRREGEGASRASSAPPGLASRPLPAVSEGVWGIPLSFAILRLAPGAAESRGVAAQPRPAAQRRTGGMWHRVGRAEVAIKVFKTL